jgi:hypothetical protein
VREGRKGPADKLPRAPGGGNAVSHRALAGRRTIVGSEASPFFRVPHGRAPIVSPPVQPRFGPFTVDVQHHLCRGGHIELHQSRLTAITYAGISRREKSSLSTLDSHWSSLASPPAHWRMSPRRHRRRIDHLIERDSSAPWPTRRRARRSPAIYLLPLRGSSHGVDPFPGAS